MTQKYDASSSVVRRLPRYYRLLGELERSGQVRTSSRELGRRLGMTASQIRQDLCGLVGAGSLGKVVSENVRFEQRGFRLVGIFDIKPELIGRQLAGLPIQSMDALDAFCAAQQPAAAVLCLPKESAQTVAERLVSLGVRGLWNFSHCDLAVENAQVVTMHLDDSLMTLSYKLHNL